jgi:putative ABC transport system permease protein
VPPRWPYLWRQGLSNLHRPSNQTVTVVLAIGFGAFLLGTLLLVQSNLLRQLQLSGGPARPNLVLFDIQPDQLAAVEGALAASRLPAVGPVPIVPMRIAEVKGTPVGRILGDTTAVGDDGPPGAWAYRREYRSTYRDTLVGTERLVAGEWWSATPVREAAVRGPAADRPARISVEVELARELRVDVGDEIVWDVQGLRLRTRVASLREV